MKNCNYPDCGCDWDAICATECDRRQRTKDGPMTAPFDPAAWQLVPKVATEKMRYRSDLRQKLRQIEYRDLLAIAPTPPVDVANLLEQVEVMRKALEPFAAFAVAVEVPTGSEWGALDDSDTIDGRMEGAPTIGDCRDARAALKSVEGQP